jgi:hypothetical protein
LMDVNVETFEASDGILIQHFNYWNVIRKPFNCSSKVEYWRFCDIHTLLVFFSLLSLLEVLNTLTKFAQGKDVIICDFVLDVKIWHVSS